MDHPLSLPFTGKQPPASWTNPDAVYTPEDLADFLLAFLARQLDFRTIRSVLEPSAGRGAWVESLAGMFARGDLKALRVLGVDLDPHCGAGDLFGMQRRLNARDPLEGRGLDGFRYRFEWGDVLTKELDQVDLVLGNPPYSAIPDHVDRALQLGRYVAFLLPLDILGGGPRATWYQTTPAWFYLPIEERPRGWENKLRGVGLFAWDRELAPLSERRDERIGFAPVSYRKAA